MPLDAFIAQRLLWYLMIYATIWRIWVVVILDNTTIWPAQCKEAKKVKFKLIWGMLSKYFQILIIVKCISMTIYFSWFPFILVEFIPWTVFTKINIHTRDFWVDKQCLKTGSLLKRYQGMAIINTSFFYCCLSYLAWFILG